MLESSLNVSEYTDNVDIVSRRNKAQRIVDGIMEVCGLTTGLSLCGAGDAQRSASLNAEVVSAAKREPSENDALLQEIFEVGRRNKILNPAKMRSTYGKLMYLLQDSQNSSVERGLQFSLHKDLVMVVPFLAKYEASSLLDDKVRLTHFPFLPPHPLTNQT